MPYFFLSYARERPNVWIQQFYRDLCEEFRRRAGLSSVAAPGFMDTQDIEVGEQWPAALTDALRSCRVFLALYSPRYFASLNCGREWAAFARRSERQNSAAGRPADAIIPILWVRPKQLPEVASRIQAWDDRLGDEHQPKCVYDLIRLNRHHDEYQEFLSNLSLRMIEVGRRVSIPPGEDHDFEALPSAFPPGWTPAELANLPSTPSRPLPAGPPMPTSTGRTDRRDRIGAQHVTFLFAAPSIATGAPDNRRRSTDFYGDDPQDWRPYLPRDRAHLTAQQRHGHRLSLLAQRHALSKEFTSDLGPVSDDLQDRLQAARERNQVLLLLVDPWTAEMTDVSRLLRLYDRQNEPTTGVLIPFSAEDEETTAHQELLERSIRLIFDNNSVRGDPLFRLGLPEATAFGDALQQVLVEAQNRVFSRGTVMKRAGIGDPIAQPILRGP